MDDNQTSTACLLQPENVAKASIIATAVNNNCSLSTSSNSGVTIQPLSYSISDPSAVAVTKSSVPSQSSKQFFSYCSLLSQIQNCDHTNNEFLGYPTSSPNHLSATVPIIKKTASESSAQLLENGREQQGETTTALHLCMM